MSGKIRKNIGFSLLPFSFIFLFEPSYALLDPLPDFIGYIILCFALINLADINPAIMDALKGFSRAAVLSVIRLASYIVLTFAFEGQEQTVTELLLIFVFALFDAVILIPAYKNLFNGLLNLGIHHDGSAVYYCKKSGGMNRSEKMYLFSCVFVITKNLLWALPEFTSLAGNDTYEFIGILRLFAMTVVVPISIAWLVNIIVYFVKVRKDDQFIKNLLEVYVQKSEASPSFFDMRTSTVGILVLTVAFALSIDMLFDNFNATPDFLMYLLLICGALILRKYSKRWLLLTICSSLGIVTGVTCFISSLYFYSRYLPTDVIRDIGAYNAYYFMLYISVAESVTFMVSLITCLALLYDVYSKNTDLASDIDQAEQKRMNKKFNVGAILTCLFGAISSFGALFYVYSIPNVDKAEIFGMANVLRMVVAIIFIFTFWYFAGYVKGCIKQHCKSYLY